MPNPYSYGSLVVDPAMFFGREAATGSLCTRLHGKQSTSVVGLRRIGKSSLLYQLARILRAELGPNFVPLYIDLHDARYRTVAGFVQTIIGALNEQMGGILTVNGITDMSSFSKLIERLSRNGICPVLCLDEFEEFIQHPAEFGDDFLEALRSLGSQSKLAMVTASSTPLVSLIRKRGGTSPLHNIFTQIELGLLEPEAARALRRNPLEREGTKLSPEDEALVEELAGRHPFFLQMACYHLYEAQSQPPSRRADVVRERFNHDAEVHFDGLWEHLDTYEKAALRVAIGQAIPIEETEKTLKRLAYLGVVERVDGKWQVFSDTFAKGIKQYPIPREVQRAIKVGTEKPVRTEEPPLPITVQITLFAGVAIVVVVVAALISLLVPEQRIRPMLIVAAFILLFALVGTGKLTGYDFLQWLGRLLGLGGS